MKFSKTLRKQRTFNRTRLRIGATECLEARILLSANSSSDTNLASSEAEPIPALVSAGFQPLSPDGSLAYVTDISGQIDSASSESRTFAFEAGQLLSLEIDAGSSLFPLVLIRDPNNQILAVADTLNVGDGILLNNVEISTTGVHTIEVFDDLGLSGEFSGRLAINSAFEQESHNGVPNNSLLSAENIDGAFNQVGAANQQRAHVTGTRGADLEEDFESVELGPDWTTETIGDQGRIRISKAAQADSGVNFLLMDREVQLIDTLNEAIWTVDLSSVTEATLEFSHARFNDEENLLPDSFTGHAEGDGVAVSEDGITWHTILNSPDTENFEWTTASVDLVALADSVGISLDSDFHIKFQQFDNGPFSSDGRGYDAIKITTNPEIQTEDWYELSLNDGQYLSLALSEFDFSVGSTIELYSSNETLLATSSSSQNADQVIVNYLDVTSNGLIDSYYVRVIAPAENYGLLATKDLSFDKEWNSSFFNAQDISSTNSALGFVDDSAGTSLNLLSTFPGTDFTRFVPADPIIAAGPTHVVAVVNSRIGIYDKGTGQQIFTQPISDPTGFFGSVGATGTTFDPWILYDTNSERFFLVAIDVESDTSAHLYFAVSTSSSPTSGSDWHKYQLDFAHDPEPLGLGTGIHFADYEKIGVTDDAIFVTGNYFSISDEGSGVYQGITAFDKQALIDGAPLDMLYQEFFLGFGVFPLHQYDSTTTQYFVESLSENAIRVHAVTDVATNPVRHSTDITVPMFERPGLVPQLGDVVPADVLDARIMSGVMRDQSAWFAHTAKDPTIDNENVARWYEIALNDFPTNTPTLVQHGNVDPGPNVHAFFPAITVDENHNMGIGFSLGGSEMYLSAGFTGRLSTDPLGTTAFPVQQYIDGLAPYEQLRNNRNRWGDYSGISIDPTDDRTFWVYNMYASETGTWDTQIGSFQLDPTPDTDWYAIEVNAGDVITIETSTPFDGPSDVTNFVDPEIELYDESEQLLATDLNSAADGRNTVLTHVAATSGTYRVRVIPTIGTGTYVLNIDGTTGNNPAPTVIASSPTDGHIVNQFPTTYEILFSEQIDPTTVASSDLTINGQPAQSATVAGDRIFFTIDPASNTGDGTYNLAMQAGNVADYDGNPTVEPFAATLLVDTQGVSVTSTRWNGLPFPEDATLPSETLVFEAFLNETPFQLGSARRGLFAPGTDDIFLTNLLTGEVIDETSIDVNTITNVFSATYEDLPQGSYELRLVSGPGAFLDRAGNSLDGESNPNSADGTPTGDGIPGGDYVINFILDDPSKEANEFSRIDPLAGLSSRSLDNSGFLHDGDIDQFSFFAEAGETISAVATINNDANASLEIIGLGDSASSAILGGSVNYEPRLVTTSGFYELLISGDQSLEYSIDIFRNSVSETAISDSSPTNILPASGSFVTLGSGRFGIVGSSSPQFGLERSNAPGKFVDISNIAGTVLDLANDGEITIESNISNIAIPGPQLTVGNNGGVLEGMNINLLFQNLFLPSPDIDVDTAFFPYWEDLGESRDHIYVHELEIDGIPALVVQWEQMPHNNFPDGGDITFQLQIFDSGPVLARYAYEDVDFGEPSIDFGGNATIGYENVDGRFVQHSLNTPNSIANGDVLDLMLVSDVDVYSLDLSSHIGKPIDIVLKGQNRSNYSGETMELLDSSGNVVATAVSNPLGANATNYDLGIFAFNVVDSGTNEYLLRVSADQINEYGIEITESIIFESEPNLSGDVTRNLETTSTLIGYLSGIDLFDVFSIDLLAGQNINLQTSTPFDSPQRKPLNNLNPTLRVLGPDGRTQLAIDRDSKDGKNAELTFEAPTSDTYFVEVQIGGGLGEYLLHVEQIDLPSLSISDGSIIEGDNGTSLLEFTVTRSSNVSDVSVNVRTADGSAIAGEDFVQLETSLDFVAGGDLSKTVQVSINGDQTSEPDEEFSVQLFNANGATFDDATGVGTILDDDTLPTIESVRVSSSDWSGGFLNVVDPVQQLGYPIPSGSDQLTPIPWEGIDQIHVEFSNRVSIDFGDIFIEGLNVSDYTSQIESIDFDDQSLMATIHLDAPLANDRIRLNVFDDISDDFGNFLDGDWENGVTMGSSGDGVAGGTFSFAINLLPGDVNGNALVDAVDILAAQDLRFENVTSENYDSRVDLDGSGLIDSNDLLGVRNLRFTFLPVSILAAAPAIEDARDVDEESDDTPENESSNDGLPG